MNLPSNPGILFLRLEPCPGPSPRTPVSGYHGVGYAPSRHRSRGRCRRCRLRRPAYAAPIGFDARSSIRFSAPVRHGAPQSRPRADRDLTGGGHAASAGSGTAGGSSDERVTRIRVNQARLAIDAGRAQQCPRRFVQTGRERCNRQILAPTWCRPVSTRPRSGCGHRTAQHDAVFGDQ